MSTNQEKNETEESVAAGIAEHSESPTESHMTERNDRQESDVIAIAHTVKVGSVG